MLASTRGAVLIRSLLKSSQRKSGCLINLVCLDLLLRSRYYIRQDADPEYLEGTCFGAAPLYYQGRAEPAPWNEGPMLKCRACIMPFQLVFLIASIVSKAHIEYLP
jgi:hypothetical protein